MKYFAYGSNMNPQRMKDRGISFYTRLPATLIGYTLKFNKTASHNPKEGYANIVPDENQMVEGALLFLLHFGQRSKRDRRGTIRNPG